MYQKMVLRPKIFLFDMKIIDISYDISTITEGFLESERLNSHILKVIEEFSIFIQKNMINIPMEEELYKYEILRKMKEEKYTNYYISACINEFPSSNIINNIVNIYNLIDEYKKKELEFKKKHFEINEKISYLNSKNYNLIKESDLLNQYKSVIDFESDLLKELNTFYIPLSDTIIESIKNIQSIDISYFKLKYSITWKELSI